MSERHSRSLRPRLGIIGGGQLALMTASAANALGADVVVLERKETFPALRPASRVIVGDWNDRADLERLAKLVDVVTIENEFVDARGLAWLEEAGLVVAPGAATIDLVQDKLRQKEVLREAGLPVCRFAPAPDPDAVQRFGFPAVLKRRRNGYDGKGNAWVDQPADLASAWEALGGGGESLYVEERCHFITELAVIVTRDRDGRSVTYPVVESINRDHCCHVVLAPAAVDRELAEAAERIARRAIEAIDGVGSFGVELFLSADGNLLINELAPRVHNTGHYSIEACACSQFENHVRAVFGWPLGSPELLAPAAAMVNLLGRTSGSGRVDGLAEALAVPGARVHLYGKEQVTVGRKMGHVTALGPTPEAALERARRAAEAIRFGGEHGEGGSAGGRDRDGQRVRLAGALTGR